MHASPTVADGLVFVAANKDKYYAVNAATGGIEWIYNVTMGTEGGGGFLVGSMSYHDGRLFIVDQFFITCLDAETGASIWKSWLGVEIYVSPTYADGKIYVATDRRSFYVLDAENGERLSYFETGSSCWSSPSVYEGRVYIGNQDWNVYCLDDSPVMSGQISVAFAANEVEEGDHILGCGQLSLGIAYAPVNIFFAKPDDSMDSIQVTAGPDGTFGFDYIADVAGDWIVSIWCSGASYIMNSEYMFLTVTEQQPPGPLGIPIEYVATLVVLGVIALIALAAYMVVKKKDSSSPVLISD